MKIYNKKGFFIGLFWLVLSIADLCMFIYHKTAPIEAVLCLCTFLLGITYIARSLSRNLSDEDCDELSELIINKSRRTAFAWTKGLCIFLIVYFVFLYSWMKKEIYITLFVGFGLMLIGMIIIEAVTELYYESKYTKKM